MDPKTHRRWLDYIEAFDYFGRGPDKKRLDLASWQELDVEYRELVTVERTGGLDAEGVRRLVALRRVLLRD